jgi:hypothetical protein
MCAYYDRVFNMWDRERKDVGQRLACIVQARFANVAHNISQHEATSLIWH